MKVGFIGLGVMGRPMALHLHAAGHELHVWARRPQSAEGLPATVCATPAELGRACAVVFTVITSSADVEGVALGLCLRVELLPAGHAYCCLCPQLVAHLPQPFDVDVPVPDRDRTEATIACRVL